MTGRKEGGVAKWKRALNKQGNALVDSNAIERNKCEKG